MYNTLVNSNYLTVKNVQCPFSYLATVLSKERIQEQLKLFVKEHF